MFEETGILIPLEDLVYMGPEYARHRLEYIFDVFRATLRAAPVMNLGLEEHTEGRWLTIEEGFQLPLMAGGKEALEHYQESL